MMRATHSSVVLLCAFAFTAACGSSNEKLFGGGGGMGGVAGSGSGGDTSGDAGAANGGLGAGGTSGGTATSGGAQGIGGDAGGAGATGPSLQSGSRPLPLFNAEPSCVHTAFVTPFEVPASELSVLVTLVHPDSDATHDATSVWTEGVTQSGFEVCVTEDARFDGEHPRSRIDWVAYVRSAASELGFASGRVALTGAETVECTTLTLPAALATPNAQATITRSAVDDANHGAAVWIEALSAGEARLCSRALANGGTLAGSNIDWLAYSASIATHGFKAGEVDFPSFDNTHCETVATGCTNCENVQVNANHRRRPEAADFLHGALLTWVEDFDAAGHLTVCARETSEENQSHDAHMSIDWLVRDKND